MFDVLRMRNNLAWCIIVGKCKKQAKKNYPVQTVPTSTTMGPGWVASSWSVQWEALTRCECSVTWQMEEGGRSSSAAQMVASPSPGISKNQLKNIYTHDLPQISPLSHLFEHTSFSDNTHLVTRLNTHSFGITHHLWLVHRSWNDYKQGFGDFQSARGEFWLGNDNLHFLTSQG